jgi:PKD domain
MSTNEGYAMLKKYGVMAGILTLPAFLAGCPVDIYTNGGYGTYYPDVVVVGETIPDDYGRTPSYTYGKAGRNPIIQAYTANPTNTTSAGMPITFQVVAHDGEDDVLQYNWSATGGTLSTNTGQVVSWIPPDRSGVYTVTVTVANGRGGFVMGSQNLTVQGDGTAGIGGKPIGPVPTPTPVPSIMPSPTPMPTPTPSATASATPTPSASPTVDPEKSTIAGVIKDDAGPLDEAKVVLTSADPAVKFEATFFTGDDGKYRFVNAPAGVKLMLSATKTGYDEKIRTITALKGIENTFDFDGTFALKRK